MPYIIVVNMPGCLPEQEPIAKATLAEARESAADEINERPWVDDQATMDELYDAAGSLPETGGIVGPLPDGYI